MKEKFFSKVDFVFLFFVTLAFSLRTIYFTQTIQFIQPGLGSDGSFYLQWAEDIVRGEIIGRNTFFALPIYPYFLSLAYLFSGGEIFSLILIQIFLGSLNCGLIYILGKKLFNLQVGIMAGIFASFYMMFIFYDRMLGPTSLAIFLGLVLMLVMLRLKENPSVKAWWTVGFSLGLCALTAASFLLLFVLIIFWLFYEFKKEPRQTVILSGLAFIVAFSLMVTGITLRNYLVAQDPALITAHSGINFYLGNNTQANGLFKVPPYMRATQSGLIEDAQIIAETISARRLKPSEASNFWFKQSLNFIHTEPLTYLKLLGKKFLLFYNGREYIDDIEYYLYNEKISSFRKIPLFGFSLILPLAVLGIFCSWPKRKEIILLYLFVAALSLATISFFINSRYRLTAVPFLIIFAAQALWQVWQTGKTKQYKNLLFLLSLFFALYFLTNIKVLGSENQPNATFHYNKGVISYDQGQYQMAAQEFKIALRLNPIDFMSYLGLGNTYHQMHDYAQAITSYKQSIAINPCYYDAYFNLGVVYNELGKTREAERQFQKVVELKPDDYAGHYNLGKLYQGQGKIDLGFQEYQKALKVNPTHPEILKAIEEIASPLRGSQ